MNRILTAAVLAQLTYASAASAQLLERGYLQAAGGTTLGAVSSPTLNAEAGIRLTPRVAVFVSAGRLANFSSESLLRPNPRIAGAMEWMSPDVSMSVRASAIYGVAGARYELGRPGSALQPYVIGSAAGADQQVRFMLQGRDVTAPIVRTELLGASPSEQFNAPIVILGAGVSVPVKRIRMDVGYGVSQFITNGPPTRLGNISAGLGLRF